MNILSNFEPTNVFKYFEEITKIPHGSGNEKQISDYIVNFAKERNLFYYQDESNNVLIKKKGSVGYENSKPVIIQGHIDMVCEKNADTEHNFLKEGLKLEIDGDYIRAKGTTLGADNGIAVAYALALLDSNDIDLPPLECLFTTDEEVGMKGAMKFDTNMLEGKRLINIDSEEEGKLLVSCCGGMRVSLNLPVKYRDIYDDELLYSLKIRGLKGGHSGSDIHMERANAHKLMGRLLYNLSKNFKIGLAQMYGGAMDNAICREADAVLSVKSTDLKNIKEQIIQLENIFKNEYRKSDNGITLIFEPLENKLKNLFDDETLQNIITVLNLIPYGVIARSIEISGLVESSSNIGIVKEENNFIKFTSALRSSVSTRKDMIFDTINIIANSVGASVECNSSYPEWEYNPKSEILKLFKETYQDMFKKEVEIEAIHAGLECGIFARKIPNIDIISFGPNMYDVHTPFERLSISSTKRTWDYLKEVLKRMK